MFYHVHIRHLQPANLKKIALENGSSKTEVGQGTKHNDKHARHHSHPNPFTLHPTQKNRQRLEQTHITNAGTTG